MKRVEEISYRYMVEWFGERGIEIHPAWFVGPVGLCRVGTTDYAVYRLELPEGQEGVFIHSTDAGMYDVTCVDSGCYELADEITAKTLAEAVEAFHTKQS